MSVDVADLAAFYETQLGSVASRLVGRALARTWSDLRGLSLLGLGFATPYLPILGAGCTRIVAFMPAAQGVTHWPIGAPSRTALADPLMLPLADGSFDRILIVHALETSESPDELLHEISRILTPAGRVILVCPNRRGFWARMDATPFGQGQPFSRRQLRHTLRDASLAAESWSEMLYWPPIDNRMLLRSAAMWERCGETLSLPFAGLHVVEAVRKLHRPVLVRSGRRVLRPRPVFNALPASREALPAPRDAVSASRETLSVSCATIGTAAPPIRPGPCLVAPGPGCVVSTT